MIKEKIYNIKLAIDNVRKLRRECRDSRQNFQCTVNCGSDMVYDAFIGDAYDVAMPIRCQSFDLKQGCIDRSCPNYSWSVTYVDLVRRFREAKQLRNKAILGLFNIKSK